MSSGRGSINRLDDDVPSPESNARLDFGVFLYCSRVWYGYACHWLAVGMTWTWTPLWRGAASILHWSITGTFPDIYAYYLDRRIAIHYLYYIVSLRFLSSWCYTLSLLGPFSVHSNFTRPPTEQSFRINVSAGSDVCVSSDSWRSWVCK